MQRSAEVAAPTPTSGWHTVRFGDVVVNRNEFCREIKDGERFIAGEHIDEWSLAVDRWGVVGADPMPPTFNRKFVAGDVLFHSRNLAKVAAPRFAGITGEKLFVLRPTDASVLLPQVLPYVFLTSAFRRYASGVARGSVNKYLNWKQLADFTFDVPGVKRQTEIAELLQASSASVLAHRRLLKAADDTARALRANFFEQLSETATLGDTADMQLGKMLSPEARTGPEQLPYLANINVRWERFDLTDLKTMSFDLEHRNKFRLRSGDVLVCEGRGVGRSAVWRDQLPECYYQKALHRLRVRDERVTPEYLVQYFRWCSETGRFAELVGGGLIPHLTEVKFRRLDVRLAPTADRDTFLARAAALAAHAHDVEAHIEASAELERHLSSRLLTPR